MEQSLIFTAMNPYLQKSDKKLDFRREILLKFLVGNMIRVINQILNLLKKNLQLEESWKKNNWKKNISKNIKNE